MSITNLLTFGIYPLHISGLEVGLVLKIVVDSIAEP